ncbi:MULTISPECIES: uroporphyrinogen decarboxylase family protein [unclassified Oceanispirochaeta]|uniref:uroporphyrinogen decarboxylase family protein n=1 Tax=unclassified Oceanispirochaeta TaxID=2635722 RepID=UPI000E096FBC|nr:MULTISPECIES: uroporphyrinogen decarboxylase family protein [unclassified Oceanispirochaeta]MBF9018465.1 uroporphyrinogen decarboxylase family protein [Oceanispirochaeta sp. M2]NPD74871.1 hypothetical protein [Oceanispirochaeta sp. M1]RDG29259.1 hypothetical protein DV872_22500 [Oceanispirochaeta sp. M1]
MNSLERVRRSIRGEKIDRFPVFPILIAPACQLTNVKLDDYMQNADVMANTLIKARELCDFDGIYVSRDNWVYHQALGGSITFPEDDESFSKQTILSSMNDFRTLSIPEPSRAAGMKTVLEASRKVMNSVGNEYYIQSNIDVGPVSLASVLRGAQNFMIDLYTEKESDIHDFLSFCSDVIIAYGQSMIETGVHGIQYGDSTAGLLGPDLYEKFALPHQVRTIDELSKSSECDFWLHICGDAKHILHDVATLNIQGFEVDSMIGLEQARISLGDKIALKGGIDTSFILLESENTVYENVLDTLKKYKSDTGLIFSSGCGIPKMTPIENLKAMSQACKDYHISSK